MPEELRLKLFGGMEISLGENPLKGFYSSKASALLCYLAVTGKPHTREALAGLLWTEMPEESARAQLRIVLSNLRKLLPKHLQITRQTVAFRPDIPYSLDVELFEKTLTKIDSKEIDVDKELAQQLNAAMHLYGGDFLAGIYVADAAGFDEWQSLERERLRQLALQALHALASYHAARGEYTTAIDYLTRLLKLEPWREDTHRQMIELFLQTGQRNAALAQYETCSKLLKEHMGVEPSSQIRVLYDRLKMAETAPQNNLPAPTTSFIGRAEELAEVKRLLTTTRLLTLTGVGGCGKTRLALEGAADLLPTYTDGIWLVELASITEPTLVLQAVAATLGVREAKGQRLTETLAHQLRPQQLLLVLDNCEHLVEASAQVAQTLLNTCPKLRILATSREALGITGELVYSVPPLSRPELDPLPPLGKLAQYEAVRLFTERARFGQPDFALTSANASAVAQVCHRLDGIPLALELAAARLKILSVEQIAERLDDSLRLLTGGSRTALPRHQTLKAVIEWSFGLLPEQERILFRRLAVFAGGFTLEAVEKVCAETLSPASEERIKGGSLKEHEILDLLTHLVGKSLVTVAGRSGEVRYYRLLETVKQYSWEKLVESRELEKVRDSHLEFYLRFAQRAELQLTGKDQAAWLTRLESDHENLRAALEWSSERHAEAGLILAIALGRFWDVRGYLSEGREWLTKTLHEYKGTSVSLRARALHGAGNLARLQGDYAASRKFQEESLRLYRQCGDRRGIGSTLNLLGTVALEQGDNAVARSLYEESLGIHRELGDKQGMANAVNNLGILAANRGDYASARSRFEETLTLKRELADRLGIAHACNNLGRLAHDQKDYERAQALYEEALALFQELGSKQFTAKSLINLGLLRKDRRDYASARTLLKDGLALSWSLGGKFVIAYCLRSLVEVVAEQKEFERAVRLIGTAQALCEAAGISLKSADYDRCVAAAHTALGESRFTQLWDEGRAMTLEQAIEYALEKGAAA